MVKYCVGRKDLGREIGKNLGTRSHRWERQINLQYARILEKSNQEFCWDVGVERKARHRLVYALSGILFVETAVLAAVTAFLILELFVATPDSYVSAVALAILAVLSTVWLAFIALHTLRGRTWVRSAAVVWQVLFIAVAVGSLQGLTPRADIAWLLFLPAIAVLVLLFTKPVIAATTDRDPEA